MKAMAIEAFGGPNVFRQVEVAKPEPKAAGSRDRSDAARGPHGLRQGGLTPFPPTFPNVDSRCGFALAFQVRPL